jgi:hypothetical protein
MRRVLGCFAFVLTLGCEEPAHELAETDEVRHTERLRPGAVHRYAVAWRIDAEAQQELLGDVPLRGGVVLKGELELRVHERRDDGALVGVRLHRVDEAAVAIMGQNVLPTPDVLLAHEAFVLVPDDGDARRTFFAPDAPPVFRHMMAGLVANIDLRVPVLGAQSWPAVARTDNGLAEVTYERETGSPSTLQRRVARYLRLDAVTGRPAESPAQIEGETTIELGPDDLPQRISGTEPLVLPAESAFARYAGTTSFDMERLGSTHGDPDPTVALDALVEHDLHAPPDDAETERELARRFAEGMTTTDLVAMVQSAGLGLRPSPGELVQTRGLLRGWPELAYELGSLYVDAPDLRTRTFIIDQLVSADTPEAQDVIAYALEHSAAEEVPPLVAHLTLLRTPTPTTLELLVDLHVRAQADRDDELRRAVLYPMGSAAGQLARTDPLASARLLATIRAELSGAADPLDTRAAIDALGNAASAEDVPWFLGHATHPDLDVRAAAASALRFANTPETTDVLFALLDDPAELVAAQALSVIQFYRPDPDVLERLSIAVMNGHHHPKLVGSLVGVLAKRGLDDDVARGALVSLWQRETDPHRRVRIARILGLGG